MCYEFADECFFTGDTEPIFGVVASLESLNPGHCVSTMLDQTLQFPELAPVLFTKHWAE